MLDDPLLVPLADGQLHRFRDWARSEVPRHGAGVYAIWDHAGTLIYVGMSGRSMTADTPARATPYGLFTRLASHANGRRSGDQFCVYVADRLVLPRLTPDEIAAIAEGSGSMDRHIRTYVRDHLAYRFVVVADGATAYRLESLVRGGALGQTPLLNPTTKPPATP